MKLIVPPKSYKELRSGSDAETTAGSSPEPRIAKEARATGPARAPVKEKPSSAKPPSEPPMSAAPVSASQDMEAKAKMKCSFRIPRPETPSHSAEYTQLIEHYGEDAAIKLLLRAAIDEWIDGYTSTAPIDQTPRYAKSRDTFATTRHLDSSVIEQVQRRIDPMNRRPTSYIARMIALTALAAYLERH